MLIKIRQYASSDETSVIEIFRSNIPKYFSPSEEAGLRDFLDRFADHYFICQLGREVIGAGGFALNDGDEPTISLCWGMVHADYLGNGFGRQMTAHRIEAARRQFGDLPIVIRTSQHTAAFYEKFGFITVEHQADGFGPGIDICSMRLAPSSADTA